MSVVGTAVYWAEKWRQAHGQYQLAHLRWDRGFLYSTLTGGPATFGLFDLGSGITAILGSCLLLFLVGLFTGRRRVR